MVVCRKAYHKRYYAKIGSKSWPGKNDIVPRTLRFSNRVVKAGMKITGESSSAAREPIVKRTRRPSEITEHNTVDVTMLRIRNRSAKDFVTKKEEK